MLTAGSLNSNCHHGLDLTMDEGREHRQSRRAAGIVCLDKEIHLKLQTFPAQISELLEGLGAQRGPPADSSDVERMVRVESQEIARRRQLSAETSSKPLESHALDPLRRGAADR